MSCDDRGGKRGRVEVHRRAFLRAGGMGAGALGLPWSGTRLLGAPAARGDRALILLMLVGGPSQLETWDPKPDAPEAVRGPFGSIATRVPGVRISEHLPRIAARMDRIALIRSVYHDEAPIHETGLQLLQTGRLSRSADDHPHIGAVVSRLSGRTGRVPAFAMLPGPIGNTGVVLPRGQTAGGLGSAHEPVCVPVGEGEGPCGVERDRLARGYGSSRFGRSCLLARRLVEEGVRVVTVNMFDTVFDRTTWDCHGSGPFSTLEDYKKVVLPTFDRVFSALIDDLEGRGMLETTLVAAVGEFGRTPRLNAAGGRDHWPGVWSIALAGGGVQGGRVIGKSDARAEAPSDRPVAAAEVPATIYHALGVDPSLVLNRSETEVSTPTAAARPVHELFL